MARSWPAPASVASAAALDIHRIGLAELRGALHQGWQDFLAAPTQLLFLGVLYPAVGLIAAAIAAQRDAMHLLYPMAAGFALIGPVAALGLYEISRRREQGLPVRWLDAASVLRSPAIGAILALGLLLVAIFVAWLWTADAIHAATLGRLPPDTDLLQALTGTAEGRRLILFGNAAGFVFAVLVLVLTAFSFPFLLDRGGSALRAVAVSVRAFAVNPLPMTAWGVIVAALLILGSLPIFVGLAVVLPVLGHATWHLYRRVVG